MKKDNTILRLSRVEVVTRSFNAQNQCVKEEFEYYFPDDGDEREIGFKAKKPKKRK